MNTAKFLQPVWPLSTSCMKGLRLFVRPILSYPFLYFKSSFQAGSQVDCLKEDNRHEHVRLCNSNVTTRFLPL